MSNQNDQREFVIEIDASPEEVWRAVSEAEGITRWFAPGARVEPGAGGKIWLSWGPGMEGEAPITIWEPGKRFAWDEGAASGSPRVSEFQIEGKGGKTVLRLIQSGFGAATSFEDEYDSTANGWRSFLALLRYDLETQKEKPARHIAKMSMSQREAGDVLKELLGAIAFDEKAGEEYAALLPSGTKIAGRILFRRRPGYMVVTLDSMGGGALGLFSEGMGETTALTTSWYLRGDSILTSEQLLKGWQELTDQVCGIAAAKA